jgi:hypothetical protein
MNSGAGCAAFYMTRLGVNRTVRTGRPVWRAASSRNHSSRFAGVFAQERLVALLPLIPLPASQPVCNNDWPLDLTGTHCEVGPLTGTNDLLRTWLAVAENWAESDEHREVPRVAQDE